jgi:hypothetical protein
MATVDVGGPFKIQSTPYTIAASAIEPEIVQKRIVWIAAVVLAIVIAYVIVRALRTKQTQ